MGTLFYKYRKINKNTLDSLRNKYFYFAQPFELNDPFDSKIPIDISANSKGLEEWCTRNNLKGQAKQRFLSDYKSGKLLPMLEKKHKEIENRFCIFCLSQVWNESMLWAHYADSGKGICIGYNTLYIRNEHFLKLDLRNKNNEFFTKTADYYLCPLVDIKYEKLNNEAYNPFKGNIDVIKKGYLLKQPKWKDEKEYRAIIINPDDLKFEKRIYYVENSIKEVIFGIDTSINDIETVKTIMDAIYTNKIRYYKVSVVTSKMVLDREEIDF